MTQEEIKAKELVEKFKPYSYYDGHDMTTRRQREESNVDSAKECAEICVDEIIAANVNDGYGYGNVKNDFWYKVKEEIQKL